jgi:hypothetical protein
MLTVDQRELHRTCRDWVELLGGIAMLIYMAYHEPKMACGLGNGARLNEVIRFAIFFFGKRCLARAVGCTALGFGLVFLLTSDLEPIGGIADTDMLHLSKQKSAQGQSSQNVQLLAEVDAPTAPAWRCLVPVPRR